MIARQRIAVMAMLAISGCAKQAPLGQVSGKVTFAGRPLGGVQVVFAPDPDKHPDLPRSTGQTDDQGRYQLQCDDGRPGAVAGNHLVSIVDLHLDAPVIKRGSPEEDLPQAPRKRRFPTHYERASTSPLKKEVTLEEQTIDLALEKR